MSLLKLVKYTESKDLLIVELDESELVLPPAMGDNWGVEYVHQAVLGSGNLSSGDGTVGTPLLTKLFKDTTLLGDGTVGSPLGVVAEDLKNSKDFNIIEHCINNPGVGFLSSFDIGNGGTISAVNSENEAVGIHRLQIGTGPNSRTRVQTPNSKVLFFDSVKTGITFRTRIQDLPSAGDEYILFYGVSESVSTNLASQTNCVGFLLDRTNLSGLNGGLITNWILLSKVGATTNVIDTGLAPDILWNNFTMESNTAVNTNLNFYNNGVLLGTFATALQPNFLTISPQLNIDIRINKLGGVGTVTKAFLIDFMQFYKKY